MTLIYNTFHSGALKIEQYQYKQNTQYKLELYIVLAIPMDSDGIKYNFTL